MEITLLPKTKLGKYSLIMMVLSWMLFIVGSLLPSKPDYSGLEIITQNPLQTIITVFIFLAGIITVITGLLSFIKYNERSVLVFLAILSGLYSMFGFFGTIALIFLTPITNQKH